MYIVADIGGTKTRIAGSEDLTVFNEPIMFDTPLQYDEAMHQIVETARRVSGGAIERMVAGVPGSQAKDHRSTFVSGTGTLGGWSHRPLADDLEQALSTQVILENDTALVGLGEATHGAGRDADIVVYVTVSTGVGAVRIVDRKLEKMAHGAEMGGQYVSIQEGRTLEQLVSGTAVREKYGMSPRELGKESAVWDELAKTLAYGIYNTLLHWSPEKVVLGGSMFNEIGISVESVRKYLEEINIKLPEIPRFAHSELGDLGGLYGALERLKQLR